jgi:glycyl-tRNA synthetase
MDKIVSLAKRRGFIYPGSEIYGGLGGTWDYGPLGTLLKKNIKDIWWQDMVQKRDDVVGMDAAIIMNPQAWVASGHVEAFTDPLIECKSCHQRFRVDSKQEILDHINIHKKKDKKETEFTNPEKFNLLVKAYLGVIEGKQSEVYLRGEITNGVQVNFANVLDSTRIKIPFGIAQIGKAFRNEITPGNFTFRSREFEQMEVQFYIRPDEKEGKIWFEYWKNNRMDWYLNLGMKKENLRFRDHKANERAHYARQACDLEYHAPWGWSEFMGIHNRGDWDLKRHEQYSGRNMHYKNAITNEEYLPWDIETSAGVDRSALFFLIDAYFEDGKRTILKFHPKIAPIKAAIFPLVANNLELVKYAREIYKDLKSKFYVYWDDRGNIGKRYYAQDEIGTPWCITIDYDTLKNNTVTIRERDTTKQIRLNKIKISDYFAKNLG